LVIIFPKLMAAGAKHLAVMSMAEKEEKGKMSVKEAGHKGGEKTAETHGKEFYKEIGHKGGQKVRELIEKAEGKEER
jgi:general stress protein YciG